MKLYYFVFKFVLYTFIFLGISNSSYSKALNFNQDAKNISNYFSGTISFDDFDYLSAKKFFNNLDGLVEIAIYNQQIKIQKREFNF